MKYLAILGILLTTSCSSKVKVVPTDGYAKIDLPQCNSYGPGNPNTFPTFIRPKTVGRVYSPGPKERPSTLYMAPGEYIVEVVSCKPPDGMGTIYLHGSKRVSLIVPDTGEYTLYCEPIEELTPRLWLVSNLTLKIDLQGRCATPQAT